MPLTYIPNKKMALITQEMACLSQPTVHRALDKGLIGICPDDFSIHGDLEVLDQLVIQYRDLNHLRKKPAPEALNYLWNIFEKAKKTNGPTPSTLSLAR